MRSAVFAMFSASAGFVIALPGQVVKRQLPTSTITVEAHPMTFWPLAPLAATATPLSYASPPSPIRVPPGLHINAQTPPHSECTPTSPSRVTPPFPLSPTLPHPTAPPDSAPTCTKIQGAYPVSTLPSFCRPTLFANAPAFASAPAASPAAATATVTLGANSLADKVSCCAACAGYYNCLAWRFVPSYTGPPSDRLPGGFDPWRHGSCEVVYHTGDSSGGDGLPALCPNGRLSGALDGTANPGQEPWFEGLYYNGWNLGACGDLGDVLFQGGKDAGVGDLGALCSGG